MKQNSHFRQQRERTIFQLVSKFRQNWRAVLIAPIVIFILIFLVRSLGLLQNFELQLYDWYGQRPAERLVGLSVSSQVDDRIVIIEISESDYRTFQPYYPIPDGTLADLLAVIQTGKPAVIGLDIFRDLPVLPDLKVDGEELNGGEKLTKIIKNSENLIGIEKIGGSDERISVPPHPGFESTYRTGFNDMIIDPDGFIRRGFLGAYDLQNQKKESFSLLVAALYCLKNNIEVTQDTSGNYQLGKTLFKDLNPSAGGYVNVDRAGFQTLINWQIPPKKWKKISISKVLNGGFSPELFQDKIVLIGATAPSLNDFFNVPYYRDGFNSPTDTYGVEIHANLIKQFIDVATGDRFLINTVPNWFEWGFTLFWLLSTFILLNIPIFEKKIDKNNSKFLFKLFASYPFLFKSIAIVVTSTLFLLLFTYLALVCVNLWLPVLPSLLAIVLGGFATMIAVYVLELKKANTELDRRVNLKTQELKAANSEIKAKTAQLVATEKLSSLGLIVSEINHDLGSPISSIRNDSEMALELLLSLKHKLNKPVTLEEFNTIISQTDPLLGKLKLSLIDITSQARLAHEFLDSLHSHNHLSRHGQNQTLFLKKANFNHLVGEYIKLSKKTFLKSRKKLLSSLNKKLGNSHPSLSLKAELDPNISEFFMDSNALSRVILNLVLNALDTVVNRQIKTADPDYYPTITIQTVDRPNCVLLTISDNGEGIAKHNLIKIFDPSYTTKRRAGGTGLGLYIVYNLVRSFAGGQISVYSQLGSGTIFEITWSKYNDSEIVISLPDDKEFLHLSTPESTN